MRVLYPALAVVGLIILASLGAAIGLDPIFGVLVPYAAFVTFVLGFVYRIVKWAQVPVPFRIPSTCGQHKSFPWLKNRSRIDNPSSWPGVVVRMFLEIFCFRSLFRNTKAEIHYTPFSSDPPKVVYGSAKWLWLAGLAFHWSFLLIVVRHYRFFTEPIPWLVQFLESLDGFMQFGVPALYMTDGLILAAVTYLFIRRVVVPQLRYISLPADYFPLFLIFGIVVSGMLMRYITRIDVVGVKELAMGWVTLHPTVPDGIGIMFYIHLLLVSVLLAYFPFSKLMHAGGVFLSPTRNLANNNRVKRHINPWNYPVKVHTYEEYEDEFRDLMKEAGIPVEKE
jgi:nitrate reductase gamma subunit